MKNIKNGLIKTFKVLSIILALSPQAFAQDIVDALDFIDVQKYGSIASECVYADVLNHSKQKPYGDNHGRYTNVHETAHGIHNELRNFYKIQTKLSVNVLYCLNGKGVIIKDPKIKMRHIPKYIPANLRSSRYKVYLIDQVKYWDDVPTYILDEWNCYLLGAECAIDDFKRNRSVEKTDAVSGALELGLYSIAMAMAVKENDPDYWDSYPQFRAFMKYNLIRAEKAFGTGSLITSFKNQEQDRLQYNLLNDVDSKDIREFLKTEFDGIFVN